MKQTIIEVESGTVDLVFGGKQVYIQFNCSCEDALPYCKAMCCRHRPHYNVGLEEDEVEKYDSLPNDPLPILNHVDNHCIYLDGTKCSVHEDKPKACKKWHCSPGGVGEGLEDHMKDFGWALTPARGNLQDQANKSKKQK